MSYKVRHGWQLGYANPSSINKLWGNCKRRITVSFLQSEFFVCPVGQATCRTVGWRPCIDGKEAAMCKEAWVIQVCKGWDWFSLMVQMRWTVNAC